MPDLISECHDDERPPLVSLELKIQLLRDRVTSVARRLQTGLYVHGEGGIGKTHTVLDQLDRLGEDYRLFNSRMTAKGLFSALKAAPDAVLVLEDMERLCDDRDAQGVLRSALWATQGRDRRVTWVTGAEKFEFTYRGGVILLANRPLSNMPELKALATRITVYRLEVTTPEMAALIHKLAAGGYQRNGRELLPPETCAEVARHLMEICREIGCQPDLRLLFNAYHDFLLWEGHHSACHWHDLVGSRAREAAAGFKHEAEPRSPEEKKAWARQVIRELVRQYPNNVGKQLEEYLARTKKSRADFFRRKREIENSEFDPEVRGDAGK